MYLCIFLLNITYFDVTLYNPPVHFSYFMAAIKWLCTINSIMHTVDNSNNVAIAQWEILTLITQITIMELPNNLGKMWKH